jgi:NAD(P)-dependent dehydrogenase (short-subunit alcohol dehydrogenase family)
MKNIDGFASYPSLRDRVIVVTGGASGIGEAIVEAFAKQNAQVAFLDIQDEAAEQLTERLRLDGATVPAYYYCDLTDIAQVKQTAQSILNRFRTVDVLVNNAGNDTRHKVAEVTSASWDLTIALNLKHQFFMAQAVLPSMQKAQSGSIINTDRQQRLWITEEYKREILANQALKRMILPEEVARLVLFLASDDSSAITNQSYIIDGGWV